MEEEKKPMVGQEFLSRAAAMMMRKASGQNNDSPDDKKTDWKKEAETAEERRRYELSMKAMSGDEQVETLRLERERETTSRSEAAITRAQQLEDAGRQRSQDELDEAKRKAQEEAAERKRLEDEKSASDKAAMEQKQAEMTEKFNQAMQANSPESFLKNYRTWKELQRELDPEDKAGTGADPTIAIELKKLELQQAKDDREFKWKMRQDDKQFQLEMQKMQDEREYHKAELAQQARKDDMFAAFPQRLGGAIAKGMVENEGSEDSTPQRVAGKGSKGEAKSYHIELEEGQTGEIECPNCHSAIGVAAATQNAVCVGCNSRFAVVRKAGEEAAPAGEQPNEEEE